jgi:hypothetical protein
MGEFSSSLTQIKIYEKTGNGLPVEVSGGNINDNLQLTYVGKNWILIQGLPKSYRDIMKYSETTEYFITGTTAYNKYDSQDVASPKTWMKILNKSYNNVPSITQDCMLYISQNSGSTYTALPELNVLEKNSNALGETYICGLKAPNPTGSGIFDQNTNTNTASGNKAILIAPTTKFQIRDTQNNILIDDMTFYDPNTSDATVIYEEFTNYDIIEQRLTFRYPFSNGETQLIKLIVGDKKINELGIWQEELPFNSTVPVADVNPPGLDISYLRNPLANTSLFDIKGLTPIIGSGTNSEIKYVKEMLNTVEANTYKNHPSSAFNIGVYPVSGEPVTHSGFLSRQIVKGDTVVYLFPFHTFIAGDKIELIKGSGDWYDVLDVDYSYSASASLVLGSAAKPDLVEKGVMIQSQSTTVKSIITLAETQDKDEALKAGFYNVMITKAVPLKGINSAPTQDIYRQLFVCHRPKDKTGAVCSNTNVYGDNCSAPYDTIFNQTAWKYDIGVLLYLANKQPIFRKYISGTFETFQIIL